MEHEHTTITAWIIIAIGLGLVAITESVININSTNKTQAQIKALEKYLGIVWVPEIKTETIIEGHYAKVDTLKTTIESEPTDSLLLEIDPDTILVPTLPSIDLQDSVEIDWNKVFRSVNNTQKTQL